MAGGDITYVSSTYVKTITVTTTITCAGTTVNPSRLISTNDITNNPPLTITSGAKITGNGTSAISLNVSGICLFSGVTFESGSGAGAGNVNLNTTTGDANVFENCTFKILNTFATSKINSGNTAGNISPPPLRTKNCLFLPNTSQQLVSICGNNEDVGSTFSFVTSCPSIYFSVPSGGSFHGSDLSAITTTLFGSQYADIHLTQCKLGAGVSMGTQTVNPIGAVWLHDCNSGNVHYSFGHYNYYGSTIVTASIYQNNTDGAAYDVSDDKNGWKITGTNGTYLTPYKSPWIDVYNEASSAVTPRLEILRDGSATAYNDNQVWGEFSAKVTATSTIATIVDDRCGLVATPAAQGTSALTGANWTGEGATAWFGKLEPTSTITPSPIGHMRARVCVAGAITVYVNPKLLGI